MKPTIEVVKDSTYKTRLTITPDRVTLKVAKGTFDDFTVKLMSFTEHVLHQFVDIKGEWRGEIKTELDGLLWFSIVLRNGNHVRKYQAV